MTAAVNAGPRLDRLPVSSFHWRILGLVGAGMFLDGFEIYLAGSVLGVLVKQGWSNLETNAHFISATFVGMVLGAWFAGVLGDRYGRRYSYQLNLLIFGLASLVGAAAPSMDVLIGARFFMGLGLGAEIVVGYVTVAEFVPPKSRGRWLAGLSIATNSALLVASALGYIIIPHAGWRAMFVISGVGALIVWYLRKNMPESPRWLEAKGKNVEAARVLESIEAEVSRGHSLPAVTVMPLEIFPVHRSVTAVFSRGFIMRTIVGTVICIAISVGVYGLVVWLPTFFIKQGFSVASSLGFTALMSIGGPVGGILGYFMADRVGRKVCVVTAAGLCVVLSILYPIAHSPALFIIVGFGVVTAIYLLITVGWALYVPELYPTDLRMRGTGVCNAAGRLSTIVTPYLVVWAYTTYGIAGVVGLVALMMALVCLSVVFWGPETKLQPLESLVPENNSRSDIRATNRAAQPT
jgi:MFS transporter, putative metabolite:H+ symporter